MSERPAGAVAVGVEERKASRGVVGGDHAWQMALHQIFRSSWDAIAIGDEEGRLLDVNESFVRMTGYGRHELVGRPINELDLWVDVEDWGQLTSALAGLGSANSLESHYRTRSGEVRSGEFSVQTVEAGPEPWVVIVGKDTTEQKEAEAALHVSLESLMQINEQRKRLMGRLVSAQEEERRRISAEIHDDTIQAISSASMSLSLLRRSMVDPDQSQQLARTEARVKTALARLRNLAFDLRPPALHNAGLAAATRDYVAARMLEAGLEWHLESRMSCQPSPEARLVLYRITQEAVSNVLRHAHATRVDVVLEERDGGFVLQVTDDGVGYPARHRDALPGHLGLACMRERAELAGGWCRVEGAVQGGTTVECWIPGTGRSLFAEEELERQPVVDGPTDAAASIWDERQEFDEDVPAAS